ncbi:MAG: class I tRNA ligase family protein, partial [Chloroflexaceae bacterium]|nr:class I tRNA ligase family protein [Chloroflexaceae bacterium]
DAFGLPAENAAIKLKTNPAILIRRFSSNYKRQMNLIGTSYDWNREINSSAPEYYHWTQWIFVQLYNHWYDKRVDKACPIADLEAELREHGSTHLPLPLSEQRITADEWNGMTRQQQQDILTRFRLAYRGEAVVNWDPVDKTVIANEEVDAEGRAWRSGALVERKILKQWFFRISAYADRLEDDLDEVDWPNKIVAMQRNWVGRSEGAEVIFTTEQGSAIIVFTTRPDTLWGATFMVLAPEHPLVAEVTSTAQQAEVAAYIDAAKARPAAARTAADDKEKTGVFTGGYAINPVNNECIPIWIADYVLMDYGTGAIMAVPAHDERDFAFAQKFDLPIVPVVARPDDAAKSYVQAGTYTPDLPAKLRAAGYSFSEQDGALLVSLTGAQAATYAELVHEHLHSGWSDVMGSGWLAIFPEEVVPFESLEADQQITQRITLSFPEDEVETKAQPTYMRYLAQVPFYQDIIYHAEYGPLIHSGPLTGRPGETAKLIPSTGWRSVEPDSAA